MPRLSIKYVAQILANQAAINDKDLVIRPEIGSVWGRRHRIAVPVDDRC
ncbi:MAG: hypothetical protein K0U34_00105 [Alphaproteobacteria bacterium]|nr:hypothetical protein [Alphaproteobacteria bacterium]